MNTNTFIVSNKQIELDQKLVPYDIRATTVHVRMLIRQKLIPHSAGKKIVKALRAIEKEYEEGKFVIERDKGLHLTLEAKVVEKIGEEAYFMHTARSRNDQVATAELLYLREKTLHFSSVLVELLSGLLDLAEEHVVTVMPGYTHMQPAKPTTFGQWCLAYFDMLVRCLDTFQYIQQKYNLCPLGAIESYGTSWHIDRAYSARLLGFAGIWEIPQDAISSRGVVQLACLGVLKDIAIVISKMASDLLLFTTYEYGYIELGTHTASQMHPVTGSSVMPQKKNPDVLELIRSSAPQVIGYESIVANLLSGLPMGYNRDSREVKEYLESGFAKIEESMNSLTHVLSSMKVQKEKMEKSVLANYSLATDLADAIACKNSLPYRKVYKLVGELVKEKKASGIPIMSLTVSQLQNQAKQMGMEIVCSQADLADALDPHSAIKKRIHQGGSAPHVMQKMIAVRRKLLHQITRLSGGQAKNK